MNNLMYFLIKKILFLSVILCVTYTSFAYSQPKTDITLALFHSPPHAIVEENQIPKALLLDILQAIAPQLNIKISPIACPLPRCLNLLAQGKVDMIGHILKTPERENIYILLNRLI